MASKKIGFSVWGRSAQKFNLGDEVAMHPQDGYTTKPQTAAKRIERLTGLEVVSMREDGQEVDREGTVLSTTYQITLGRTLYRRGLGGKRQSDGCSVEGEVWVSITSTRR